MIPSIRKEINPEYSLEGLMLKPKLQYFGHLMDRADSLEKTLMLGKIKGRRRRGQQRMRCLYAFTSSMEMSLSNLPEMVNNREASCTAVHGVAKSQTQLSDWTELKLNQVRGDSGLDQTDRTGDKIGQRAMWSSICAPSSRRDRTWRSYCNTFTKWINSQYTTVIFQDMLS